MGIVAIVRDLLNPSYSPNVVLGTSDFKVSFGG